ncbi:type VII secretion protein EccE [Mycobacterium hubeiense]|uniref:type VII secretion protein EccE n=1 Tax=Mycobacterium hubeiense TaxID=1867256 RepID=UPI000C7ED24A|nr:type VII secretion protein EccE [Mycobacterium sp. QGD 101]
MSTRHANTAAPAPAGRRPAATGGTRFSGATGRTTDENSRRFPLRPHAPLLTILTAEVVAGVIAGVLVWRGLSWPWRAGAAAAVFLIAFVAFKDASLTHWVVLWWRWWRGRKSKAAAAAWADPPEVVEVALPNEEGMAGVRWDGDILITAVELTARPHTPTVLADGIAVTTDVVPLDVVADCLWQYDTNLVGIDVASTGRRVAPGTAYAGSYDQLIGVKPGVTARRTWLIVRSRFDPDDPGIRNRGGGVEGAVQAALAATRRLTRRMREHNCLAVVADAASLCSAHAALAAGLTPSDTQIERGTLATPSGFVTTYRLHPDDLTNVNMGAWWAYRCVSAAVIMRITPAGKRGEVQVRTWVRHVSSTRPSRADRLPGLIRQYCDQAEALTATLPLGALSWKAQRRIVSSPQSTVAVAELSGLRMPVGPSGQLIGYTPTGHPLLLPLSERGTLTRVYVHAPLWVAQQLVLRALAGGASARVTSGRPEAWWPMIRRLAEPRRLWLSQSDSTRVGTIQVCDHAPISYPSGAETLLVVGANPQHDIDADVVVRMDRRGQVTVAIDGQPPRPITLDATKEETRYLGRLD